MFRICYWLSFLSVVCNWSLTIWPTAYTAQQYNTWLIQITLPFPLGDPSPLVYLLILHASPSSTGPELKFLYAWSSGCYMEIEKNNNINSVSLDISIYDRYYINEFLGIEIQSHQMHLWRNMILDGCHHQWLSSKLPVCSLLKLYKTATTLDKQQLQYVQSGHQLLEYIYTIWYIVRLPLDQQTKTKSILSVKPSSYTATQMMLMLAV